MGVTLALERLEFQTLRERCGAKTSDTGSPAAITSNRKVTPDTIRYILKMFPKNRSATGMLRSFPFLRATRRDGTARTVDAPAPNSPHSPIRPAPERSLCRTGA